MAVMMFLITSEKGSCAIGISIIAVVLIFLVGPIDHKNKRFADEEMSYFITRSRLTVSFQSLLIICGVMMFDKFMSLWICMSLAMLAVALSGIFAKILKER